MLAQLFPPNLLKYSALYLGYVAFLHTVDGPWRHWKDGREGAVFDPWTLQHVLWGVLGQRMGLGPAQILTLSTLNEAAEYYVRTCCPDLLWGTPETPHNVAMDVIANMIGWKLGEVLAG